MDLTQLIDPALLVALEHPNEIGALLRNDLASARAIADEMTKVGIASMPPTNVQITERTISGDIPIVIYEPISAKPRPALLWIHGGGYMFGSPHNPHYCIPFAEHAGCTIISVDYRLAPEHPFPAAAEDCYAALQWLTHQADELGIDPDRIAIGGASAGGGLAASVALMNRDRNGTKLIFQLLLYPMLDDTHDTASAHAIHHHNIWNREVSLLGWKMYLGDAFGGDVSPYAAAYRATNLRDLPPAYITVGTLDIFRDDNIEYARRLMAADINTELAVFPGMTHGGEAAVPTANLSQRMRSAYMDALKRALMKELDA